MANPPVHRLANELLSHIFSFCPSSFNDFHKSPNKTDRENGAVALRVGLVSHHWRAVSHATPILWRTITVISPWVVDEGLFKLHAERVKHYLKLSGNLPLRIVLDDFFFDYKDDDELAKSNQLTVMDHLIYPLTGENYRWELFYANLPSQYFAESIFGLIMPMPLLTELYLKVDERSESSLYASRLHTETPKLERLTIYGLELCNIEEMPCFASNSALRYISVGGIDLDRAVSIIHAASADMAVELRDIDTPGWEEPIITCSSHTLSIHMLSIDAAELASVLMQLTLASGTKALEFYSGKAYVRPFPLVSFQRMLSRSSSTEITNFTLRSLYISDTHLLNLLAALPCLTHLTIEEDDYYLPSRHLPPLFSNAFFDVLADSEHNNDSITYTERGDPYNDQAWWLDHFGEEKPFDVSLCPLLPRLTDLVLVFCLSSITEKTVKMIESRVRPASEGIARLQFVSLHYHGDLLDEKALWGLKKVGETEGLKLDVRQLLSDSESERDDI